jgi:hypothetical protein
MQPASLSNRLKPCKMHTDHPKHNENMLIKVVKNFFQKLTKSPEEYPVKYYKKSKNYVRDRHARYLL